MSDMPRIVLDTLGKLHAHGATALLAYCRRCDRHFDLPLPALVAAALTARSRDAAHQVRGLRTLPRVSGNTKSNVATDDGVSISDCTPSKNAGASSPIGRRLLASLWSRSRSRHAS